MDKKLTDSEIVKSLECCILSNCGRECPLYYTSLSYRQCREATRKNAIDLINRLQAEIERLKTKLNIDLDNFASEYDSKIKAEAYKEFAERLKEKHKEHYRYDDFRVRCLNVQTDNLLKELVGEDNG